MAATIVAEWGPVATGRHFKPCLSATVVFSVKLLQEAFAYV